MKSTYLRREGRTVAFSSVELSGTELVTNVRELLSNLEHFAKHRTAEHITRILEVVWVAK